LLRELRGEVKRPQILPHLKHPDEGYFSGTLSNSDM